MGTKAVLDKFIEDDARVMLGVIEQAMDRLSEDFLLSEEEAQRVIQQLQQMNLLAELKNIHAAKNRMTYTMNLLLPYVVTIVSSRPAIEIPSDKELSVALKGHIIIKPYMGIAQEKWGSSPPIVPVVMPSARCRDCPIFSVSVQ